MNQVLRDVRSYFLLLGTQFLTVINDNLFKQSVLLLAVSRQGQEGHLQSIAQALFSLPFLLFAVLAGDCADRWPKRSILICAKFAEALIMLLAAAAFWYGSLWPLLGVVFLMGAQSSFLGPAKYGSLPELSTQEGLPRANGLFQASVLGAILLGTGAAGHVAESALPYLALGMAVTALVGAGLAMGMRPQLVTSPPSALRFNPLRRLREGWADAAKRPGLRPALWGHALFWMVGSLMLIAWNEFLAVDEQGFSEVAVSSGDWSIGLAVLSVFMAIGALIAGQLQRTAIRRSLVGLGSIGMALGFLAAALVPTEPWPLFLCMATASFFSGFYLIPLRTLVQKIPPHHALGATLGTSQMLDFGFIFFGAMLRPMLTLAGVDSQGLLALIGLALLATLFPLMRHLPHHVTLSEGASADEARSR